MKGKTISEALYRAKKKYIQSLQKEQIDGIRAWNNADDVTKEILLETSLRGV